MRNMSTPLASPKQILVNSDAKRSSKFYDAWQNIASRTLEIHSDLDLLVIEFVAQLSNRPTIKYCHALYQFQPKVDKNSQSSGNAGRFAIAVTRGARWANPAAIGQSILCGQNPFAITRRNVFWLRWDKLHPDYFMLLQTKTDFEAHRETCATCQYI